MILRKLVFAALRTAASNPEVRKQASKLAQRGLQAAKPSLMQASRKAGQAVRSASDELSTGVRKFKAGRDERMMWPRQQTKVMVRLHS